MGQSDSPTANPLLTEEIPQTLDELRAKVQKLFHCMIGPPMAYFQIALEPSDPPPHEQQEDPRFVRIVYVTLGAMAKGKRKPETEARLVRALLETFLDARRQLLEREDCTALLYWREPISIGGNNSRTFIRCRVAIPGVTLKRYEITEGVPFPVV